MPEPGECALWLLELGQAGVALTSTNTLARTVVRAAVERWPRWWNTEVVGPPYQEAELPMLTQLREGLLRTRLMRRRGRQLLTTSRGRERLNAPAALIEDLRADIGAGDAFDTMLWPWITSALSSAGENGMPAGDLMNGLLALVEIEGWRDPDGQPLTLHALWHQTLELRSRAEAYGLLTVTRDQGPMRLALPRQP